jgi:hypothetical protein
MEGDYIIGKNGKEKSPFILSAKPSQVQVIENIKNMDSSTLLINQDKNQNVDVEGNYEKDFNSNNENEAKAAEKLLLPISLIQNGKISEKDETNVPASSAIQPAFKRQKGIKKYLGLILAVVAAIQYSLSALILKVLHLHPFNLGTWRFIVMMCIPIPFLCHAVFRKKQDVFKPLKKLTPTLVYIGVRNNLVSLIMHPHVPICVIHSVKI